MADQAAAPRAYSSRIPRLRGAPVSPKGNHRLQPSEPESRNAASSSGPSHVRAGLARARNEPESFGPMSTASDSPFAQMATHIHANQFGGRLQGLENGRIRVRPASPMNYKPRSQSPEHDPAERLVHNIREDEALRFARPAQSRSRLRTASDEADPDQNQRTTSKFDPLVSGYGSAPGPVAPPESDFRSSLGSRHRHPRSSPPQPEYVFVPPAAPKYFLWDSTPIGPPLDLSRIGLVPESVRVHAPSIQSLKARFFGVQGELGFLIGRTVSDYLQDAPNSILLLDRFDAGKRIWNGQDSFIVPSMVLRDDIVVKVTRGECAGSAVDHLRVVGANEYYFLLKLFETSVHQPEPGPALSGLVPSLIHCVNVRDEILHLSFRLLLPVVNFRLMPIYALRLVPTTLTSRLTSGEQSDELSFGYVTIDQARQVLPLSMSDPKLGSMPLVGIWINQIPIDSHQIYQHCIHFIKNTSLRFMETGRPIMLIVSFEKRPSGTRFCLPKFYECVYQINDTQPPFRPYGGDIQIEIDSMEEQSQHCVMEVNPILPASEPGFVEAIRDMFQINLGPPSPVAVEPVLTSNALVGASDSPDQSSETTASRGRSAAFATPDAHGSTQVKDGSSSPGRRDNRESSMDRSAGQDDQRLDHRTVHVATDASGHLDSIDITPKGTASAAARTDLPPPATAANEAVLLQQQMYIAYLQQQMDIIRSQLSLMTMPGLGAGIPGIGSGMPGMPGFGIGLSGLPGAIPSVSPIGTAYGMMPASVPPTPRPPPAESRCTVGTNTSLVFEATAVAGATDGRLPEDAVTSRSGQSGPAQPPPGARTDDKPPQDRGSEQRLGYTTEGDAGLVIAPTERLQIFDHVRGKHGGFTLPPDTGSNYRPFWGIDDIHDQPAHLKSSTSKDTPADLHLSETRFSGNNTSSAVIDKTQDQFQDLSHIIRTVPADLQAKGRHEAIVPEADLEPDDFEQLDSSFETISETPSPGHVPSPLLGTNGRGARQQQQTDLAREAASERDVDGGTRFHSKSLALDPSMDARDIIAGLASHPEESFIFVCDKPEGAQAQGKPMNEDRTASIQNGSNAVVSAGDAPMATVPSVRTRRLYSESDDDDDDSDDHEPFSAATLEYLQKYGLLTPGSAYGAPAGDSTSESDSYNDYSARPRRRTASSS
ncbi:uncharacterized protein BJ171DRAFT_500857 [Polychytrium aggregatum]|uniref:uncharacterized protein n=1 Tax=Polychytrium aggregatum TaxID=110093 RepID=UPI0022FDD5E7|nr:uncharacterized protein BJ171DRAFT_500857 [Polychytrium aggregatum]KAI9205587.1 hypothetical protein BJ171DRAFT_500857 [Polychytrium aggregatum]